MSIQSCHTAAGENALLLDPGNRRDALRENTAYDGSGHDLNKEDGIHLSHES